MRLAHLLVPLALAGPAVAQDSGFVEANILGIFYHELGHAVIDIEGVPIFGQEEDAADVFSIFLIDALFEEEAAEEMAYFAAIGFWGEAQARELEGYELAWGDVHGPDEQRFFNTACIFYGADPEARQAFADDLEIPEDRQESCPFEYDQANASWGLVLDEMIERGAGATLVDNVQDDSLTGQLLSEEIAALNALLSLSAPLDIRVESCGEANAFYDPQETAVVFCSEFEDHLRELEGLLQ